MLLGWEIDLILNCLINTILTINYIHCIELMSTFALTKTLTT